LVACVFAQSKPTTKPQNYDRWEKELARLAKEEAANPPPKGALMFVGASSIVKWTTLAQDYPNVKIVNHAFGGSMICDSTHFADRIILPFDPKMIFLRAGGNDMHGGKSVEETFADYKDFVTKIRTKLPDVPIVFISQSPAPARWDERDKVKQLNELVKSYTDQTSGLRYCETYDLSVDKDGNPRKDIYVADQLHFNEEGYKLLAERVRPFIRAK
jgi:lysophospholipase L1-like esterase